MAYNILIIEKTDVANKLEEVILQLNSSYNIMKHIGTDVPEIISILSNQKIDFLFCCYELFDEGVWEVLQSCKTISNQCNRILLLEQKNISFAINGIHTEEIFHFILKPWDIKYVTEIVTKAFDEKENSVLQDLNYQTTKEMLSYKSQIVSCKNNYLTAFMSMLEIANKEVFLHSCQVSTLAKNIADKMRLNKNEISNIQIAGWLHDIGKVSIRDEILNKPGKLDTIEFDLMKTHSTKGHMILENIPEMAVISIYILQHHEKLNGTGYPNGLKGKEILLGSKILAVADTYNALISDRVYHRSVTKDQAISILEQESNAYEKEIIQVLRSIELEV